jgi:hypothetical protein
MKLKIFSKDGTPANTYVTTETGERVEGVTGIVWQLEVGVNSIAKVSLEFHGTPLEVVGELESASPTKHVTGYVKDH